MAKRIIKTALTMAEATGIFGLAVIIGSGIFGGDVKTVIIAFIPAILFAGLKTESERGK